MNLISLRASPAVSVELNLPAEVEFTSTGNFNSTERVGDARRLILIGSRFMISISHRLISHLKRSCCRCETQPRVYPNKAIV